jgi:hypothetical protein
MYKCMLRNIVGPVRVASLAMVLPVTIYVRSVVRRHPLRVHGKITSPHNHLFSRCCTWCGLRSRWTMATNFTTPTILLSIPKLEDMGYSAFTVWQ